MSSVMPYESVLPYGATIPTTPDASPVDTPTSQDQLDSLNRQATAMANIGGPGKSEAAAQQWLMQQYAGKGVQPTPAGVIPYDDVKPFTAPTKAYPNLKVTDNTGPDSPFVMGAKALLTGLNTSIFEPLQTLTNAPGKYLEEVSKGSLQTKDVGKVTQQDVNAAKLIGANVGKVGQPWDYVLKNIPEEDNSADAKRAQDIAGGALAGPIELMARNGSIQKLLGSIFNPDLAASKTYQTIQQVKHLQDVVANPSAYPAEQVTVAQGILDHYKTESSKSTLTKVGESIQDIKEHPMALINGLVADAPLFAVGIEGKLGTMAYGEKTAALSEGIAKAQQSAKLAKSIAAAASKSPEIAQTATANAAKWDAAAAQLKQTLKSPALKENIGNRLGAAASGAGINTGIAAQQQLTDQGYVQKGSLEAPAVMGAVLGGVMGGGKGHEKAVPYEDVKPVNPSEVPPGQGDVPAGTMDYMKGVAGEPVPEPVDVTPPSSAEGVKPVETSNTPVRGDSTVPQKSIIHKLAKDNGLDDSAYRAVLQKVAGVDSATALSKKAASAVIKHLKDNKVGLALTAGSAGLGAFENKDKKGGILGGAAEAMFLGVLAKSHDPSSVHFAERAERSGATPREIWSATGYYRLRDGQWAHEISDRGMKIAPGKITTIPEKLSFSITHPELQKAYPELASQLKIKVDSSLSGEASYNAGTKTIHIADPNWLEAKGVDVKEVVAHEIQHAIQHKEGWPFGDTPSKHVKQLQKDKTFFQAVHTKVINKLREAVSKKDYAEAQKYSQISKDLYKKLTTVYTPESIQKAAFDKYQASAGESQSRATEKSVDMTEGERARLYPGDREKGALPIDKQRLGYAGKAGEKGFSTGEVAVSTSLETPKKLEATDSVKQKYQDWLDKVWKRTVMESHGQGVLDDMEEAGVSPVDVSNKFWKDTYWKLPGQAQDRFLRLLKGHTGDSIDWIKDHLKESVDNIDLPNEVQYLAGTDRGFTALMKEGNDRMEQFEKTQEGPKFLASSSSKPSLQKGNADPELVKKLAYAAAFGTVGASLGLMYGDKDHPIGSAIKGAGLAMLGGPLVRDFVTHPVQASKDFSKMIKETTLVRKGETVGDSLGKWQASAAKTDVILSRINHAAKELKVSKQERLDVGRVMEGDKTIKLSPAAQKLHNLLRNFDDELGRLGISHGVLKDLIADHLSHIWKKDDALTKYLDTAAKQVTAGVSSTSAFAKLRSIKSLAEGKAKGLTSLTEDPVEILNHYARSVLGAIRNKSLLSDLRRAKDTNGKSFLVVPTKAAPSNFITINHPQLRDLMVHPAIASEMRQVFYSYDLGRVQGALDTLNMAMKRTDVSMSIFHLTSLIDGFLGSSQTFTHPIRTTSEIGKAVVGKSDYAKALLAKADPSTQVMFERGLDAGVKFQIDRDNMVDRDVGGNYYASLKQLSTYMDKVVPYGGKIPETITGISHLFDKVIFENGMNGMKFSLFMHHVDLLNKGWTDLKERKSATVIPSQKDIDRVAAGHVNTTLGAQDWIGAANQATTKFGRLWLRALGSPMGRRTSQYLMFSPDWTTSTFMSLTKAFGKGSEQFGATKIGKMGEAFRGLTNPKTEADVARMYQIRSAALYALIGGTVNYAYTGKYLWENKDPTTIDFGNGQRMQWNKHWMEPFQAARDTIKGESLKFAVGKMGPLLKEGIDQAAGIEYWNPAGRSPKMRESRLAHFGNAFKPIPFKNIGEQNANSLFWNVAGRNVLGRRNLSPQERMQDLLERRAEIKKDRDRKLKAQQKRGQ